MNILLVAGSGISLKEPYNSGIEAFMVSLANQLADEGHEVDVIASEVETGAPFRLVNPFTSSASDRPGMFERFRQKRRFKNLDVQPYDVIHYNMFYPHLLQAGAHFNKPSFLTLHSPADEKRISAYRKLSRSTKMTFVAVSERIKQQWDPALQTDLPLIHNGINMNLWPANHSGSREYLLWSARINEEKNVVAAIRLAQHLHLPLKIAGRIADPHYFETKVKPHLNQQIEYVGHITQRELSGLASKASAYLATATWQEPFGLAALEMLASGVPVVGFDTAVPPGWAHESVSTTASHRWEDLVELFRKSEGVSPQACRAFASNLNIQNMTSDYIALYKKSLAQTRISDPSPFARKRMLPMANAQP